MRRLVASALVALVALASSIGAAGVFAQEEEESEDERLVRLDPEWMGDAAGVEDDESESAYDEELDGADDGPSLWERMRDDPTLGGKLHLTYRISYRAQLYDFGRYRFPFDPVTDDDREQARQLRRLRRDERSDQDIDQYFALRATDLFVPWEEANLIQSTRFETSFRYFKDIDGSGAGSEGLDGYDRLSDRDALQLYKLFARVETFDRHLEITAGRQQARHSEWVHFDGVAARFRGLAVLEREVELDGFVGSRVRFYRRASAARDLIAGGSATVSFSDATTLRLSDVYYLYNTFEGELRQTLPDLGWLAFRYRQIGSEPHSIGADGFFEWPSTRWTLHARYLGKVSDIEDDVFFDYTQSTRGRSTGGAEEHFHLGGQSPYDEFFIEARKGLFEHYGVLLGATAHLVRDDEDRFNSDWFEVWLGADVSDVPWRGFSGHATIRYVDTDLPRRVVRLDATALENALPDFRPEDLAGDGEPSFLGFELLAEQDFERVVAVGGTVVIRSYEYRSHFARIEDLSAVALGGYVRWRATERSRWELRYDYDRDDRFVAPGIDGVHTVRAQFTYRW